MRVTHKGSRYLVLDEVLDPTDQARVWSWFQTQRFGVSAPGNWARRPIDGLDAYASKAGVIDAADPPDTLVERTILEAAGLAEHLIGTPGKDWQSVSNTCWTYAAGAQMSWHNDAGAQTGAFVWYMHPRWGASWGGELLVVDQSASELVKSAIDAGLVREGQAESLLSTDAESDVLFSGPDPVCIQARPNRLVLLQRDTFHTIRRVDPSAGDRSRCSLAGFFLEPESKDS